MNRLQRTLLCLTLLGAGAACSGDEKSKEADPANAADAGDTGGGNGTGNTPGNNGDNGDNGGEPGDEGPLGETEPTPIIDACDGQKLREGISEDPSKSGPWPVGSLTTTLGGVTTEVWYPAVQGSQVGKELVTYDMREHLPPEDAAKIPDDHVPTHDCNCYRDLPLDEEAGPYPVLLFIHGTAGFRTTNVDNMAHWASRGFVVIAADHPGIQLKDLLGMAGSGMLPGGGSGAMQAPEGRAMLEELAKTEGDVAFLKDHIDMTKVGVMGHSAGGGAVATLGDVADVIIVYAAGGGVTDAARTVSMMSVMGATDGVAGAGTDGYDGSNTATKRFVSIGKGGHLVGGNLCTMRDPADPMKDIVDLAEEYKLGGLIGAIPGGIRGLFGALFDGCNDLAEGDAPFIPASRGIEIMNYVSTGAFEEVLHCSGTAAALSKTSETYGADVAAYNETLP